MNNTVKRCDSCGAVGIYSDEYCVVCGERFPEETIAPAQRKQVVSAMEYASAGTGAAKQQPIASFGQALGNEPPHKRHQAHVATGSGRKKRFRRSTLAFLVGVAAILGIAAVYRFGGAWPGEQPAAEQTAPAGLPAFATAVNQVMQSPEGYIPIRSVEDLLAINDDLTANYILMNNIEIEGDAGNTWISIGSVSGRYYSSLTELGGFTGIFEGNGYTISGLYISMPQLENPQVVAAGLFAMVMDGEIRNLAVKGTILLGSNAGSYTYAGGIAGLAVSSAESCIIQNCSFTGQIENANYAGGITGLLLSNADKAESSVIECRSGGLVAGKLAGGIVGCVSAAGEGSSVRVEGCQNTGPVSASSGGENGAGGIAGFLQATAPGAAVNLQYCENIAAVIGVNRTGGIAGALVAAESTAEAGAGATLSVSSCVNRGAVTSRRRAGGIAGYCVENGEADGISLTNCYNLGAISGQRNRIAAIAPRSGEGNEKSFLMEECYYTPESGCRDSRAMRVEESELQLPVLAE